jgi:hypothetical protein
LIQHYSHTDIDKHKWDNCIAQSVNNRVYAYSWYLDIVSPNWEALVVNDYEAVFPLTCKKMGFHYLYQPFFTQQLGFFSKATLPADKHFDIIKSLPSKYRYIDIYLNDATDHSQFKTHILRKRKNYVLNLNLPFEKITKAFSDHTKRNLKKATRINQHIQPCDASAVIAAYKKHKGEETKELEPKHYMMLEKLMAELRQRNMLHTLGVYDEKQQLMSSAAFILSNDRIYYMMGSSHIDGKEKRSMYLLFNHVIEQFCNKNLVLDFEGSERAGIARFFKGFGADKQFYFHLRINRLPWYIRWLKK